MCQTLVLPRVWVVLDPTLDPSLERGFFSGLRCENSSSFVTKLLTVRDAVPPSGLTMSKSAIYIAKRRGRRDDRQHGLVHIDSRDSVLHTRLLAGAENVPRLSYSGSQAVARRRPLIRSSAHVPDQPIHRLQWLHWFDRSRRSRQRRCRNCAPDFHAFSRAYVSAWACAA
jgi:hypothetical protein